MHDSVMTWVGQAVKDFKIENAKVLECGSRNINGSVREFFSGPYVGVDIEEGPGVDVIASASNLPFGANNFDAVITTEMLEHDKFFWVSMKEMAYVLRPMGLLILTTRGIGFPYHEYPSDYWRFTKEAIKHLFEYAGLKTIEVQDDPSPEHPGVFGIAMKLPFNEDDGKTA